MQTTVLTAVINNAGWVLTQIKPQKALSKISCL